MSIVEQKYAINFRESSQYSLNDFISKLLSMIKENFKKSLSDGIKFLSTKFSNIDFKADNNNLKEFFKKSAHTVFDILAKSISVYLFGENKGNYFASKVINFKKQISVPPNDIKYFFSNISIQNIVKSEIFINVFTEICKSIGELIAKNIQQKTKEAKPIVNQFMASLSKEEDIAKNVNTYNYKNKFKSIEITF